MDDTLGAKECREFQQFSRGGAVFAACLLENASGVPHTARPVLASRKTGPLMLPGFNTNIRHRCVLFHVQSEDSGRDHPHIITHVYYGGTIISSEKSSYADRVDAPDLPSVVRQLMEAQHKAVLKRLRARGFDAVIVERLGAGIFQDGADPRATTSPEAPRPAPPESAPAAVPSPEPTPAAACPEPRRGPGAAPRTPTDGASQEAPERPAPKAGTSRSFGEGIVSQRPLDEVILNYLVENARKRKLRRS